ncbi:MAG: DUF2937 family protein [Rhodospirillaceae bacterium]|nr:DUF2937 family protein [Rhodospirillaceae bacterium]
MEWLAHKLDTFLAAVVIAAMAIAACQSQAFIIQYLSRQSAQLAAAKAELTGIETGLRYQLMSDTVRKEIETGARTRAEALQASYDSVAGGNLFAQPLLLARGGDPTLMDTTWRNFVPALPMTPGSIAFTVVGMVIGFVIYEVVKFPFALLIREPKRRKFRKRG